MVEATILLTIACLATGAGLAVWRALRGPARRWPGTLRRVAIVGLVTVLLVAISAWRLSRSREFQVLGHLVRRVETVTPVVGLTFDDGPLPGFTEEILDALRAEGVRATFFVTGEALEEHAAQARLIVAEGHELGNHSYSHRRMVGVSYAFVREEVERTDELIRAAGYAGEIYFRPPYSKRLLVLPYYLSRTGRTTILCDVEPESYPEIAADAEKIVQHVVGQARPGSIILLHVMNASRSESVRAVPAIIQALRNKGYTFVTVSELLAVQ